MTCRTKSLWICSLLVFIASVSLVGQGQATSGADAVDSSARHGKKIIPSHWHRPAAAYEISGGLWRVDHSFEARLQIKNHVQLAPISATPVLFMADGTEYVLPPVNLEPSGVQSLSLNVALQSAPPEIARHISDFGSVAIRYNWSWPGALDASVQSIDAPRSLIFVSSLSPGMNHSPWRKHSPHKKINQNLEALWWKHDAGIGGFAALSNTSQDELQANVRITAARASDGSSNQTVSICSHCTRMVDLGELLLDLPQ